MEFDRRNLAGGAAAFAAMIAVGALGSSPGKAGTKDAPQELPPSHDMSKMPAHWMGKEKLAFLIYPAFTALDMVGPHYMLTHMMGATAQVVAKKKELVKSDAGLVFMPDADFGGALPEVDVLCIPGGTSGTLAAMTDEETLAFVKAVGSRAKYVCSVCTGSMILGAAGLLDGYRATSHWVTKPLLPIFGASPTGGRVVRDRNRITAEGVTAGLDFGLSLLGELRDEEYAQSAQLIGQYAPEPPYDAGEPETAPKAVKSRLDAMFEKFVAEMREAGEAAFARSRSR
jgi:putative intracellular protease/amidase